MSFSNDDRLKPISQDSFENLNFNNANYDYNSLKNKPTLNGITLTGDMMPEDLGLVECVEKWTFDFAECCIFPYVQDCVEAACCYVDCCVSCMREDLDCCIQEECCFVIDTAAELSCCISCVREDLECCITDVDTCLSCCINDVDTCLACCINDVNSSLTCCINDVNCTLSCKIDSLPCGVVPIGTIPFCSLPDLADVDIGWMYNISDDFETDNRFVTPGICMLAGSNVYVTESCCYDVFAAGNPIVVDQSFCSSSSNAASGCAVDEALQCAYCCTSDICCCLEQCIGTICCCLEQCINCKTCDKLPYGDTLSAVCDGCAVLYTGSDTSGSLVCTVCKAWNCNIVCGSYVWTDGTDTYYSCSVQYKLNKGTGCWENKTWNCSLTYGSNIWTDGTDTYYYNQYKLNKGTGCWENKTWNCSVAAAGIWTDGSSTYFSWSNNQYVLDKQTGCWADTTWNCCICGGNAVWSDGTDTYYSCNFSQFKLNKGTGCWENKTWNCNISSGACVWTNGTSVYFSSGWTQLRLNKETGCWENEPNLSSATSDGGCFWTDGANMYYNQSTCSFQIVFSSACCKGHTYQKCSGAWCDITPMQAVDQCFDPMSTDAQSGTAVAEVCCQLSCCIDAYKVCNILCCNPSVADIASFPDGFMWLETN